MAITSSAFRQLSDGSGTVFGQSSTDVIGFYGVTSVVTRVAVIGSTLTAQAGAATTAPVWITSSGAQGVSTWGFATSTQAAMVVSTMTALWNMGLIG